jgi:hypothetical protein
MNWYADMRIRNNLLTGYAVVVALRMEVII